MTTETATPNRIQDLETLEQKLAQMRDELRVKIHLAKADARDQWDVAEQKWARFAPRAHELREAADEAGEGIWTSLKALGHEIAEGYDSVRRAL